MTEKNGFAQVLDKIVEGISSAKKKEPGDDLNMLPKPHLQEVGDGIIVWRWYIGGVVIESILVTRQANQMGLDKGEYTVSMKLPESDKGMYTLNGDIAKEIGQSLTSAWNWKNVWKLHAGDFLLGELSKEPAQAVELDDITAVDDSEIVEVEVDLDDDNYLMGEVQG